MALLRIKQTDNNQAWLLEKDEEAKQTRCKNTARTKKNQLHVANIDEEETDVDEAMADVGEEPPADDPTDDEVNEGYESSDNESGSNKTKTSVQRQESSDSVSNTSPRAALKPETSGEPLGEERIVVKFDLNDGSVSNGEVESPLKGSKSGSADEDESMLATCCGDPENRKKMIRTVFVLWNFLIFVSA